MLYYLDVNSWKLTKTLTTNTQREIIECLPTFAETFSMYVSSYSLIFSLWNSWNDYKNRKNIS